MASKGLQHRFPRAGRVEWIGLSSAPRAAIRAMDEVRLVARRGIEGDHHAEPGARRWGAGVWNKRQVTLIQSEHLAVLAGLMGREVRPEQLRRNVVVSGLNLAALKGQRFRMGETLLKGTGLCPPCSRVEENLGEGGLAATLGHGGITAVVLEGGRLRCGDRVLGPGAAEEALVD